MTKLAAIVALLLMTAQSATTESVPELSGTWVMDASRSDLAIQTPPVDAAKVVIRQSPAEIQIDKTLATDGFSTEKYRPAATNPGAPGRSTPTFRWEGTTLVTVQEIEINGFAVTSTERWSLSSPDELMTNTDLVVQHGYSGTITINGLKASGNSSRMKNIFVRSR